MHFARPGRRVIIGLVVAGVVFAGVFAFAASITVSPSSLGAGSGSTSACDSSVGVTYPSPTFTNGTGYTISSVTVTGLDTTACASKTVYVTLTDGSNNSLTNGSGSAAVPGSGTTVAVSLAGATSAAGVLNAHVTIA